MCNRKDVSNTVTTTIGSTHVWTKIW